MVKKEVVCQDREDEFVRRALEEEWEVDAPLKEHIKIAVARGERDWVPVAEAPEFVLDASDGVAPTVRAALGCQRLHDRQDIMPAGHLVLSVGAAKRDLQDLRRELRAV